MQPTVRLYTTGCPPVRYVKAQSWCHSKDPGLIHQYQQEMCSNIGAFDWNILVTNILILLSIARCHPRLTASCVSALLCLMDTECATILWMITSTLRCHPLTPVKKPRRHIWPRLQRLPCWTWGYSWNKPRELNCDAQHAAWMLGAILKSFTVFTVYTLSPTLSIVIGWCWQPELPPGTCHW